MGFIWQYPLNFISTASGFVPAFVAVTVWGALKRDMQVLAALLIFYLAIDLASMILAMHHVRNLWLSTLVYPVDFGVMLWLFAEWESNPLGRRVLRVAIPLSFLAWILIQTRIGGINQFNYIGRPLQCVVLVGLSIRLLQRLGIHGHSDLWKDYRFWVGLAVLVSSSGSVFAYTLGFLIETHYMRQIWGSHLLTNTLANLLFAGGFWCLRRPATTGGSS